jgi:hypothetical protein
LTRAILDVVADPEQAGSHARPRSAAEAEVSDGSVRHCGLLTQAGWRSAEAIAKAHTTTAVQALWAEFGAACDYRPLSGLAECQQLFAEFEPVPL